MRGESVEDSKVPSPAVQISPQGGLQKKKTRNQMMAVAFSDRSPDMAKSTAHQKFTSVQDGNQTGNESLKQNSNLSTKRKALVSFDAVAQPPEGRNSALQHVALEPIVMTKDERVIRNSVQEWDIHRTRKQKSVAQSSRTDRNAIALSVAKQDNQSQVESFPALQSNQPLTRATHTRAPSSSSLEDIKERPDRLASNQSLVASQNQEKQATPSIMNSQDPHSNMMSNSRQEKYKEIASRNSQISKIYNKKQGVIQHVSEQNREKYDPKR